MPISVLTWTSRLSGAHEPLTLRHLLTHSAGFDEHGSLTPTTDLEAYVKNDPPAQVFAPGTTPGYSNLRHGAGRLHRAAGQWSAF